MLRYCSSLEILAGGVAGQNIQIATTGKVIMYCWVIAQPHSLVAHLICWSSPPELSLPGFRVIAWWKLQFTSKALINVCQNNWHISFRLRWFHSTTGLNLIYKCVVIHTGCPARSFLEVNEEQISAHHMQVGEASTSLLNLFALYSYSTHPFPMQAYINLLCVLIDTMLLNPIFKSLLQIKQTLVLTKALAKIYFGDMKKVLGLSRDTASDQVFGVRGWNLHWTLV